MWDLVVGDIISLQPGDKVPADCLVISCANLAICEPEEDEDIVKDVTEDPFLLSDSYIMRGSCKAVVCCVGKHSTRPDEDTMFDVREHDTELTQRLDNIGGSLKFIGLITSVIILATSIIIVIINKAAVEDLGADEFIDRFINCFIVALIMLIVAIPEGLPMTVAVSLAYSVL